MKEKEYESRLYYQGELACPKPREYYLRTRSYADMKSEYDLLNTGKVDELDIMRLQAALLVFNQKKIEKNKGSLFFNLLYSPTTVMIVWTLSFVVFMAIKMWGVIVEKLKGSISISKINSSEGGYIEIAVDDRLSSNEFVRIKMSFEEFAKLVTGQGYVAMEFQTRGLDKIGKKMEHKELVFEVPKEIKHYSNKDIEVARLGLLAVEEGWVSDQYYGSQNSFFTKDGISYARTTQRRWV